MQEKAIGETPENRLPNPLFIVGKNPDSNNPGRYDVNKLVHAGYGASHPIMKDLWTHDIFKILDDRWCPGRDLKSVADDRGAGLQFHGQF